MMKGTSSRSVKWLIISLLCLSAIVVAGVSVLSSRGIVTDYICVIPDSVRYSKCEVDLNGYVMFYPVLSKQTAFTEHDKGVEVLVHQGVNFTNVLYLSLPDQIRPEQNEPLILGTAGIKSAISLSRWLSVKEAANQDGRILIELKPAVGDSTRSVWLACARPGWMIFGGRIHANLNKRVAPK